MSEDQNSFAYTYSAKEQAEIKKIRDRYVEGQKPKIDNMERLRRLDASVTKKGTVVSLILGVIGSLIMGLGMSLIMTDLGKLLGSHSDLALPIGVLIGVVGMVTVALAYPVYMFLVKKERQRIAPEIIRLTDELLK